MNRSRNNIWLALATDLLLLIASVHLLRALLPVPWRLAAFPIVVIALALRGAQAVHIPLVPLITSRVALLRGVRDFAWTTAIWLPLYLGAAHVALTQVIGWHYQSTPHLPPLGLIATQLFLIALPEECFFRGYVQPALGEIYSTRWAIIITAAIFAAAHSAIGVQWWHFAIFIPGLLFGALRSYSGNLVAGTLAHALSNLVMWWVSTHYR